MEEKEIQGEKEEKKAAAPLDPLALCEKEREEYLKGWQRAKADLINYKKEEIRRFEEIVKFSNSELLKELLSVLDSFDLSLAVLKEETSAKGMYLIRSQLESILKKRGVEAIKVSKGDKFDPAFHESLAETAEGGESGAIVEEVEKGYLLNGRVIRPARVKVAK